MSILGLGRYLSYRLDGMSKRAAMQYLTDRRDGKPAPREARKGVDPALLIAYTSITGRPGFIAADAIEHFEAVDPDEFPSPVQTALRTKSGSVIQMRESFSELMERLCLVSEP